MRKISTWAKHHVWQTRLLIVLLIYPLLNLAGITLGFILDAEGTSTHWHWGYPLSFLVIGLAIFYPGQSKAHYIRRKFTDALLGVSTFCFMVLAGSQLSVEGNYTHLVTPSQASMSTTSSPVLEKPQKISKQKKKTLKQLVKSFKKKYKEGSSTEKVLLIVLTILVALGLIYLLAALSCSISCGGAEALAWVVFFLGLGGIVFGAVKIIQRIGKKPKKVKESTG